MNSDAIYVINELENARDSMNDEEFLINITLEKLKNHLFSIYRTLKHF